MNPDEQAIRDLISAWMSATISGDLPRILGLMTDDVVFLASGQAPMKGKEAFASGMRAASAKFRIQPTSHVQEIGMNGNLAYAWSHLSVVMVSLDGGKTVRRSGFVLSVFEKQSDGRWLLKRDANMLALEEAGS